MSVALQCSSTWLDIEPVRRVLVQMKICWQELKVFMVNIIRNTRVIVWLDSNAQYWIEKYVNLYFAKLHRTVRSSLLYFVLDRCGLINTAGFSIDHHIATYYLQKYLRLDFICMWHGLTNHLRRNWMDYSRELTANYIIHHRGGVTRICLIKVDRRCFR